MASQNYPRLGQLIESQEAGLNDARFERATNGTLRGQSFSGRDKLSLKIAHIVERPELDALLDFYEVNKLVPVDVLWTGDGQVRQMIFTRPPERRIIGGRLWRVTNTLEEV